MKNRILQLFIISASFIFLTNKIAAQQLNWVKEYIGSTSFFYGDLIRNDSQNNIFVKGSISGDSIDFDPSIHTKSLSALKGCVFLAKYSSSGAFNWVKTYGDSSGIINFVIDNQNNILILGSFSKQKIDLSFGAGTFILNKLTSNYFVAKYNNDGNLLYAKIIGTGITPYQLKTDGLNNLILYGQFKNSPNFDWNAGSSILIGNSTYTSDFISKFSPDGNLSWAKNLGVKKSGTSAKIEIDKNNNIYFYGSVLPVDTIKDFDPGTGIYKISSIKGYSDLFFAKYDSACNFQWLKTIGSSQSTYPDEFINDLKVDNSNNIHIVGSFYSSDFNCDPSANVHILANNGSEDPFWAKYDSNGNYIRSFSLGGSGGVRFNEIKPTKTGSFYVKGYKGSVSLDFDPSQNIALINSGASNDFFAKYDTAGNYIWAKPYGNGSITINDMVADTAQNIYLTGYYDSNINDFDLSTNIYKLPHAGKSNIFVAKYNSNGDINWAFPILGKEMKISNIKTCADSSYYVVGTFSGVNYPFAAQNDTIYLTSNFGSNIFVSRYDKNNNLLWTFPIGGKNNHNFDDNINNIDVDSLGNIYLAGEMYSDSADFDSGPNTKYLYNASTYGYGRFFIAKYNKYGNYCWAFTLSEDAGSSHTSFVGIKNSSLYYTSYLSANLDVDPGPGTNLITTSLCTNFLANYSLDGNFNWVKQFKFSDVYNMCFSNNNIVLQGRITRLTDFDPSAAVANLDTANGEYYLALYDLKGNYVNAKNIRVDNNGNSNYKMITDSHGNIYITGGLAQANNDFDPSAKIVKLPLTFSSNAFFAKYDTNLNLIWAKNFGCSSINSFDIKNVNENIYLIGDFYGILDFDLNQGINTANTGNMWSTAFAKYSLNADLVSAYSISNSNYFTSNIFNNNLLLAGNFGFGYTSDFDLSSNVYNLKSKNYYSTYLANYKLLNTFADNDTTVCSSNITLKASNPYPATGKWSVAIGNAIIENSASYTTNVSNLSKGINKFVWKVTDGAFTESDTLVVTRYYSNAGIDITTNVDTVQLNAELPPVGTGAWSIVFSKSKIDNNTLNNTVVRNLNYGANTFIWTVNTGTCAIKDTVLVTKNCSLSQNTTWSKDTVYCNCDINIQNGKTLTINPGTVVAVTGRYAINVQGRLLAVGTKTDSITFTATDTNNFWADTTQGWRGIRFEQTPVQNDSSFISFCIIKYAIAQGIGINAYRPSLGGGIYTYNFSKIRLNNSVILYNRAASGGGLFCQNSNIVIVSNTFSHNKSEVGHGGGCDIVSSTPLFDHNTVSYNISQESGGLYWNCGCTSTINNKIKNSIFIGNTALDRWGGLMIANYVKLENCVIVKNYSVIGGGGLNFYSSNAEVINTIVNKNTRSGSIPEEIDIEYDYSQNPILPSFNNCAILNFPTKFSYDANYYIIQYNTIVTDPQFTNPTANDFHLQSTSPCINAGTVDTTGLYLPATDLDGNPRIRNGRIDIGAYEYQGEKAYAGLDQIVCTDSTTLSAGNASGVWTLIGGSAKFVDSPTNPNARLDSLADGINTFMWSVNGTSDTVVITNHTVYANAGLDQTICGDSARMAANQPLPNTYGKWSKISGGGVIRNNTSYNTDVIRLGNGQNDFRWTIIETNVTNACVGYSDVRIINDTPSPSLPCPTQIVCDTFALLTANTPLIGVGQWSVQAGQGIISNASNPNTLVTALRLGVNSFDWRITNNACFSDSVVIIWNIYQPANAGSDMNICGSQTYLSGNQPYNGSGLWTLVGGDGIIVNPTLYNTPVSNLAEGTNGLKWTITQDNCSSSDIVLITNNSVTASAGQDKQICDSTSSLTAVDPSPATGVWSIDGGAATILAPSNFATRVTNLFTGVNRFRWTVSNGYCIGSADVVISNNQFTTNVGTTHNICSTIDTLVATDPGLGGSGNWYVEGGSGLFVNATNFITKVTNVGFGVNQYKWIAYSNGCSASALLIVINSGFPANAGNDAMVCDSAVILGAQSPTYGQGLWSVISGSGTLSDKTVTNSLVTNMGRGANKFRWTVVNQYCTTFADVTVTNNLFSINAGADQTVNGSTANMNADPLQVGASGVWTIVSGQSIIVTSMIPNTNIVNLSCGKNTFQWTVKYNGCQASDDVNIIYNTFAVNAGVDQTICTDSTVMAADNHFAGTWTLVSGNAIFVSPTLYNTKVKNLSSGINVLAWTITQNNCLAQSNVTINNNKIIDTITAGKDISVCSFDANLSASSLPAELSGKWSIPARVLIENPISNNTTVTNLQLGKNLFIWTVTNGSCNLSDSVVMINQKPYVFAGNARQVFTQKPNSPDTLTLTANQPNLGANGFWTNLTPNDFATFINPSLYNSKVYDLHIGMNKLEWKITENNCSNSDTLFISKGLLFLPKQNSINWDNSSQWNQGLVPSQYDSVYISNTSTDTMKVNINLTNANCFSLTAGPGNMLITSDNPNITLTINHLNIGDSTKSGDANLILGNGSNIIIEPENSKLGFKGTANGVVVKSGGHLTVKPDATKNSGTASLLINKGGHLTVKPDATKKSTASVTVSKGGHLTVKPDASKGTIITPGIINVGNGGFLNLETSSTTYTEIVSDIIEIETGGQLILTGNSKQNKLITGKVKSGHLTVKPEATKTLTDTIADVFIGNGCNITIEPSVADTFFFPTTFELGDSRNLFVDNGGSISLLSDAVNKVSLITGLNSQIIDRNYTNSISGNVVAPINLLANQSYLLSSPMSNYSYRQSPVLKINQFNEATHNFMLLNNLALMQKNIGYIAQSNMDTLLQFSGNLNAGNISTDSLSYTSTGNTVNNAGWHLIGNPYLSYIDWNADSIQKKNIGNTLYFWNGFNISYHLNGTYGLSLNGGTSWIAPENAFFVKTNANAKGFIRFSNKAQSFSPVDQQPTSINYPFIKLTLSCNSLTDETAIRFLPISNEEYDTQLDAAKLMLFKTETPQIYSLTKTNTMLAINSLPYTNSSQQTITLGLKVNSPQYYTLSMTKQNTDTAKLYLHDLITKQMIDFIAHPSYTFQHDSTMISNRFEFLINPKLTGIENLATKNNNEEINIYSFKKQIRVTIVSNNFTGAKFEVYDIFGRLIYSDKFKENQYLHALNQRSAWYVVKVTTLNTITAKQVFISE